MGKLFSSVWFNGRDLLMQADDGAGGGGAPGANDDNGGAEERDQSGDNGGEGEEETGDEEGEGDNTDPLDVPQFSKRQVAQMMSGRVNEVKKQFANHPQLQEVAQLIGEIIGSPDLNTVVTNIRALHSQHRAKTGQPPVVPQYSAANQAETKRAAVAAEFDNNFAKNPEFADAELFRDEIIDMTLNGFTMAQSYWAVAGPLVSNKKAANAVKNATQVAQHKKQTAARQTKPTPGNSGNPGNTGKPVIPPHIQAAAKKIGMDPEEYVAWQNVGNQDQARALKGRK